MEITIWHSTYVMARAHSSMNATPSEEFPSENTHRGTSCAFLNIEPLPRKKKTVYFKVEKRKGALQRFSDLHKENCPGRNEDEVTDNLPPSKEALNREKLKKNKINGSAEGL